MLELFEDIGDLLFGNKRMKDLQHFASNKSFRFERRRSLSSLPLELKGIELFEGKKKKVKGYLYRKEKAYDILGRIYDLKEKSEFSNRVTTIFHLTSPLLDLPYFSVKPKSGFGKIGSIFTTNEWADISKDFGKSFVVASDDINRMNMTITVQFAEVMLKHKEYTLEGVGGHLIIYRKAHVTDIVDMDNVYEAGLALIDIMLFDQSNELV